MTNFKKPNYSDAEIAETDYVPDAITQEDILGFIKVTLRVAEEILNSDDMPDTSITDAAYAGTVEAKLQDEPRYSENSSHDLATDAAHKASTTLQGGSGDETA